MEDELSLVHRMRELANDHEKNEQGGGASQLLNEGADALEKAHVIGFCGDCIYRNATGYCQNKKFREGWAEIVAENSDMLLYEYSEGGGFWVGERFGCIHHAPKKLEAET
jgi:hypothetical protein